MASLIENLLSNLTGKFTGDATTTATLPKVADGTATVSETSAAAVALAAKFEAEPAYAAATILLADQLFAVRTKIMHEGEDQVPGHFYQLMKEFKRYGKEPYPQVPQDSIFPLSYRADDLPSPAYRLKMALHVLHEYAAASTITPKLMDRITKSLLVPFP